MGRLDQELPEHLLQDFLRRHTVLGQFGNGVGHLTAGDADLDRAELLQVAADRGLGEDHPLGGQELHQLDLARDHLLLEEPGDAVLALRLAESH